MTSGTVHRERHLDVLRGIAILLVIGRHLPMAPPAGLVGFVARLWQNIGWMGVDLFFVLSGFLISGVLLKDYQRSGSIAAGRFLLRRAFKIYPLYLLFVGFILVRSGVSELLPQLWPNLLFLQNYVGTNPLRHTWTLAVEEHFYVILPIVLLGLAARRRLPTLVVGGLVIVPIVILALRALSLAIGTPGSATMEATHLRIDGLAAGVGLRAVATWHSDWWAAAYRYRWACVIAGVLLWLSVALLPPEHSWIRTGGLTVTWMGAAAFVVASVHIRATRSLPDWLANGLAWIGVSSYGIYLWHLHVISLCDRIVGDRLVDALGVSGGWYALAAVSTVAAIAIGAILTRLIEWPMLRLRDHWVPSTSTPNFQRPTPNFIPNSQLPIPNSQR